MACRQGSALNALGEIVQLNLPETITIDSKGLLIIWGVLHFGYAIVTHYHHVWECKQELRRIKRVSARPYRLDHCFFIPVVLWRLLVGLEAQLIELAAFVILKPIMSLATLSNAKLWNLQWHQSVKEFIRPS